MQEDDRALTLADLACTLLSILFAVLVWLRGKKDGGEDEQAEQVDEDVEEDEPRGYACLLYTSNPVGHQPRAMLRFLQLYRNNSQKSPKYPALLRWYK